MVYCGVFNIYSFSVCFSNGMFPRIPRLLKTLNGRVHTDPARELGLRGRRRSRPIRGDGWKPLGGGATPPQCLIAPWSHCAFLAKHHKNSKVSSRKFFSLTHARRPNGMRASPPPTILSRFWGWTSSVSVWWLGWVPGRSNHRT